LSIGVGGLKYASPCGVCATTPIDTLMSAAAAFEKYIIGHPAPGILAPMPWLA
jgi:hypothetical protein